MLLETTLHPLQPATGRVPPSITTKTTCLAPSMATEAPRDALTAATGRAHTAFQRDFKATAPLPLDRNDRRRTAAVLLAISRTSANTTQPAAVQGSSFGPTLQQREPRAPLHPMAAAGSSAKDPPAGFCPTGAPRERLAAGGGPSAGRAGTQLSFKALRAPHLRCEPLKSFFLLFVFFFFWTRK